MDTYSPLSMNMVSSRHNYIPRDVMIMILGAMQVTNRHDIHTLVRSVLYLLAFNSLLSLYKERRAPAFIVLFTTDFAGLYWNQNSTYAWKLAYNELPTTCHATVHHQKWVVIKWLSSLHSANFQTSFEVQSDTNKEEKHDYCSSKM